MFKKSFAILLSLLLVIGCFTGCGNDKEDVFPSEPVNCIVPYSAGGGTDLMVRAVSQAVDLDGQTMVVTNIEGANALTGSYECYNAEPDGYTLVSVAPEAWIAQYMSGALADPLYSELTPICVVAEDANVLAVSANSEWENFDDFVAYAKEVGTKCTIASTSKGGSNEFFTYGLADVAGFEFTYVPYDGGSKSRTAVLGGDNDAVVCQVSEIKALVDSGDMRVLGISADERVSFFEAPTFKEQGYDIEFGLHRSIWTTGNVNQETVDYLVNAFETACNDAACQETLLGLGYSPIYTSGADLATKTDEIATALEDWAKLVK